jgi:hypothetical protein
LHLNAELCQVLSLGGGCIAGQTTNGVPVK